MSRSRAPITVPVALTVYQLGATVLSNVRICAADLGLSGPVKTMVSPPTKGPGVKEKAIDHHLREIADCLDEVLRLQSRVMELTEQVSEAAGMNRTLRGKVTGLFFGVQAYLEELNRLAKDTA